MQKFAWMDVCCLIRSDLDDILHGDWLQFGLPFIQEVSNKYKLHLNNRFKWKTWLGIIPVTWAFLNI